MIIFRYASLAETIGSHHDGKVYNGRLSIDGIKSMEFTGDTADLIAMHDELQSEIEKRMDLDG